MNVFVSDLYEGTRMARATDIPGIKQILQPLEEFGTLIRRTEEEVILRCLLLVLCLVVIKVLFIWLISFLLWFIIPFRKCFYLCYLIPASWGLGFIHRCWKRGSNYSLCCSLSILKRKMCRSCFYCCFSWLSRPRTGRQITWYV